MAFHWFPKSCMIAPDELMILLCEQMQIRIVRQSSRASTWMPWMVHLMVCPCHPGQNLLYKVQVREVSDDPFVEAKASEAYDIYL